MLIENGIFDDLLSSSSPSSNVDGNDANEGILNEMIVASIDNDDQGADDQDALIEESSESDVYSFIASLRTEVYSFIADLFGKLSEDSQIDPPDVVRRKAAAFFRITLRNRHNRAQMGDWQVPCEGTARPQAFSYTNIALTLLCGARDPKSTLYHLGGCADEILRSVMKNHMRGIEYYDLNGCCRAKEAFTWTAPACALGRIRCRQGIYVFHWREDLEEFLEIRGEDRSYPVPFSLPSFRSQLPIAFSPCGEVAFPTSRGLNVNMMPFILGKIETLPLHLHEYYHNIILRCPLEKEQFGKVLYLTVHESMVDPAVTQRRPGIHIEGTVPPAMVDNDNNTNQDDNRRYPSFRPAVEHSWGDGHKLGEDEFCGGIYMASSVANTTAIWNAVITNPLGAGVGRHGDIEHLRSLLNGKGVKLPANLLVWMTDRTPHEALSLDPKTHPQPYLRQFFRLVTSEISVWYSQHSTPNPLCPIPNHIQVLDTNKFV